VLKQQQTSSAGLFIQSFISDLESGDSQKTYAELGPSLTSDKDSAYYTWYFWMTAFKTNNVTIDSQASETKYSDPTPQHILGSGGTIVYVYNTSSNQKVTFSVLKTSSGWIVSDYAAV
jgi:hypothetical protein